MVLALFCCFSWLLLTLYLCFPKKLSRRESIFLFLVVLDVNIDVSWIVGFEFRYFTLPKTVPEYLAYLLHRSLIVPLLPVMFLNWMQFFRSLPVRTLLTLGYGLLLLLLEKICTFYGVYAFTKWSYLHSLATYLIYLTLAFFLLKWFRAAFAKEGNNWT